MSVPGETGYVQHPVANGSGNHQHLLGLLGVHQDDPDLVATAAPL